jgi:intracellular multiplication protein IcmP
MQGSDIKRDDMGMVYLGMLALATALGYLFWQTSHEEIAYFGLKWAWYQIGCFDWPIAPAPIAHWRQEAATLAGAPGAVDFDRFFAFMNKAGYLFVWIPLLLTLRGAVRAHRHPSNRTRRRITAASLPHIMAEHSPAVIPSLYYGDLLNTDPEEHRSALNPEDWVSRHAVLVNGMLDRAKCRELLIADLGKPVATLAELNSHERALFAIFGARLLADGSDHAQAQALLDKLNRSCHRGTWQGKPGYPDLSLCDVAFAKYAAHPDAAGWLSKHPYPRTLLHAMHKAALAFGRLPSSHFRWLKGIDRTLWYALNTTGRKAPFVESAAVFTQTLWESFAFDNGYRLSEPCIEEAIDGIEAYLAKIGLMAAQRN